MQLLGYRNPFHEVKQPNEKKPPNMTHKVWRSLAIDSAESWRLLRTSACSDPSLSFYVAYHFVAEFLLFPLASTLL
ncbi:unnamed protein product [Staurois parvus]|uniref:Uncharacterized protein n=1 Tax=Staurois parvus TaxID=386267 RepID=A0ABN9HDT9_9NEOB|nr:unnamed protein product [Staurois parvus]